MKLFTRTLDIVITPAENFFYFMQDIGWLIALGGAPRHRRGGRHHSLCKEKEGG